MFTKENANVDKCTNFATSRWKNYDFNSNDGSGSYSKDKKLY